MAIGKLTASERNFLLAINELVRAHPFSADRENTLALVAPYTELPKDDAASHTHVFYCLPPWNNTWKNRVAMASLRRSR